jgi:hypothetical protein
MPEHLLKQITEIEGVEGVYIASNKGTILLRLGLSLDMEILERVAVHLLRILSAYHLKKRMLKEIELIWDEYRIITRNSSEFIIVAFCQSSKALSLLRITLNVVLSHILEDKNFSKKIKQHAAHKTVVLRKGDLHTKEINLISKLQ